MTQLTTAVPQAGLADNTPAWIVYAWPAVLWQADSAPDLQFMHLGTRVLTPAEATDLCCGQTLWGSPCVASAAAGVAWDWVEIRTGVVAMTDPMSLVTNLRLVDSRGEALSPSDVVLHLHHVVHALPWQREVRRALGSLLDTTHYGAEATRNG